MPALSLENIVSSPLSLSRLALLSLLIVGLNGCSSLPGLDHANAQPQTNAPLSKKESAEALRLARVLRDNGRIEAATEVYARMDQRQQLNPRELLEYASVAALVRKPQQSLELYGRARHALGGADNLSSPESLITCLGMGRARLALNQLQAAAKDFNCALKAQPDSTEGLNGLGVVNNSLGQTEQAQKLFQQVLEIDPSNQPALNNLAMTYLSTQQPQQAITLLQGASLNATPSLVLNLALAHLLKGDSDQARQTLGRNLPDANTEDLLQALQTSVARIHAGSPAATELLAASQRPLALGTPQ